MKKMIGRTAETMRKYWRKVMDSTRNKIPLGAQYIARLIPWSRGENWRGSKEKKK